MDIKVAYNKPEDIAFVGTHQIWDQTANGAPRNIDETTRLFLWPSRTLQNLYNENFLDVLIAHVAKVEDLNPIDAVQWPVNALRPENTDVGPSVRYTLGPVRRFTLTEARILFEIVADTRANNSGVYVIPYGS